MIHERHLFGPGPSNPYPEATNALSRPLLGHLDPEFLTLMDEACELLRQAWGTSNARTLPISATGSAGMEALGLELFAAEGYRLPELTTVRVPDGVDSAAVRARLLERYDIEIGAGVGPYTSSVWRIGLMGHNARPEAALLVLAALEEAMKR